MDKETRDELVRIEEAQSFTDRKADELNQQVLDLYKKMEQLAGRVATLEKHISDATEQAEDEGDRPRQ
jgi:uncharacterized coiled-coil protein SlyX